MSKLAGSAIVIKTGEVIDRSLEILKRELAREAAPDPGGPTIFAEEDLQVSGEVQMNGTEALPGERWDCGADPDGVSVTGATLTNGSEVLPGAQWKCEP